MAAFAFEVGCVESDQCYPLISHKGLISPDAVSLCCFLPSHNNIEDPFCSVFDSLMQSIKYQFELPCVRATPHTAGERLTD